MRLAVPAFLVFAACSVPQRTATSDELDLPYGTLEEQRLDVYLPAQSGYPTVLFVFGGGWHSGSRKDLTSMALVLRAHGIGVVLPSHRLSPPHLFPSMEEDVAAAFAWTKAHIPERGGDVRRVFVMGHSSGAHLVTLLGSDARFLLKHALAPSDIAGVVGLSTPSDLEPKRGGLHFGNILMGGNGAKVFERDAQRMKDASPIQHLAQQTPRTLLVVGDRDMPSLEQENEEYFKRAQAIGARVELFSAEGCDHMGVVRALANAKSPVFARVVAFLNASL